MPWGRRCEIGCESWPDNKEEYEFCPICGQETRRWSNLLPLDEDEAKVAKARLEFEAYYEKHCEDLGQTVEGPLETPREDIEPCV